MYYETVYPIVSFLLLFKKEIEGLIPAICFFVTRCLQILQTATFTKERTLGKV